MWNGLGFGIKLHLLRMPTVGASKRRGDAMCLTGRTGAWQACAQAPRSEFSGCMRVLWDSVLDLSAFF